MSGLIKIAMMTPSLGLQPGNVEFESRRHVPGRESPTVCSIRAGVFSV